MPRDHENGGRTWYPVFQKDRVSVVRTHNLATAVAMGFNLW